MGAETSAQINLDLQRVNRLQHVFNKKLGITARPVKLMNYNPVLARFKYEEVVSDDDKRRFRKYETFQVETALRERNHAAKSSINYLLDSTGEAYNELFPDEPFSTVLERGLAYRENNGSKELMRERGEVAGWKKILELMGNPDTPIGTKAIVASGPGLIEETNYHDNFVDVYELKSETTGGRFINMVRHASSLSYDQYWAKFQGIDAYYFQETNLPIDAWLLSRPMIVDPRHDQRSADQIFHQIFEGRKDAMNETDFQKLLVMCMPVINYYINALCAGNFRPAEIALAWNAVLKKSDMAREAIIMPETERTPSAFVNIMQEVDWLGRQEIKTMAAGCGASSGFEVNEFGMVDPIKSFLSNSVGKFSPNKDPLNKKNKNENESDEYGPLKFNCPNKNKKNKPCIPGIIERPPHTLIPKCPHCGVNVKC